MTGRTHDVGAFAALALALAVVDVPAMTVTTLVAGIIANQLGALAPDLDEPTSPIWRSGILAKLAGRVVDAVLVGHRTISHSLVGAALFGTLFWLLLGVLLPAVPTLDRPLVWASFMIGFGSHLVLDSLTKQGVPCLWPVPVKFGLPPLRGLRVTTGSWVEMVVVFPALVGGIVYLTVENAPAIAAFMRTGIR